MICTSLSAFVGQYIEYTKTHGMSNLMIQFVFMGSYLVDRIIVEHIIALASKAKFYFLIIGPRQGTYVTKRPARPSSSDSAVLQKISETEQSARWLSPFNTHKRSRLC